MTSDEVNPTPTSMNSGDDDAVVSRDRIISLLPSERDYEKRGECKELVRPPAGYEHAKKFVKTPAFSIIDKVCYFKLYRYLFIKIIRRIPRPIYSNKSQLMSPILVNVTAGLWRSASFGRSEVPKFQGFLHGTPSASWTESRTNASIFSPHR